MKEQADRNSARMFDTETVVRMVNTRPDVRPFAYVVGAWVWVQFKEKPADDTRRWLIETGFRWNQTRKVWQHTGGVFRHADKRGDPRFKYGIMRLKSDNEEVE